VDVIVAMHLNVNPTVIVIRWHHVYGVVPARRGMEREPAARSRSTCKVKGGVDGYVPLR